MKSVLAALVILSLVMVGCDSNDENTVNPIAKHHFVYPIFHIEIDNNYQTFGIGGARLEISPTIGELYTYPLYSDILVVDTFEIYPGTDSAEMIFDTIMSPAWTDINGYVGTLDYGTFITDIDTVVETDPVSGEVDTIVDTSSVVFGFEPSATYTFSFIREDPFIWIDSFKTVYAITIDSTWLVEDAIDTTVTVIPDDSRTPVVVLDLVSVIDEIDTLNPPDSTYEQEITFGYWEEFDTTLVLIESDLLDYLPDSTFLDTILWGFWNRIDTFFMPTDDSIWCDIDSLMVVDTINEDPLVTDTSYEDWIEIIETITDDHNNNPLILVETIIHYTNCDAAQANTQSVTYNTWVWGGYDTTIHFSFPDTLKNLMIAPDNISILNTVTTNTNTASVTLTSKYGTVLHAVESLDSLTFELTMPADEVFPDYRIIIKDE